MKRAATVLAALLAACSPQTAGPAPVPPPGAATAAPEGWTAYTDPYGFTVSYPASLVLLPEPEPLPALRPPLLHRVRFLDRQLAAGDTAALEPPQFSVEVFAAPSGPLRPWLEDNGRLSNGSGVEILEVPGAHEALRIRDPQMLAPNEFFWVAAGPNAFLIVALGPEGEAMRKTFRLTRREEGTIR
ncbi:MAG TPA: hypothetical protein DD490_03415 [Acidobacteria bacterium]|nr:hypothetical protein [Acidobacteriota bacterium]